MQHTLLKSAQTNKQLEAIEQLLGQTGTKLDTAENGTSKAVQLNISLNGADSGIQLTKKLADELNIPFVVLNTNERNQSTAEASVTVPQNFLGQSTDTVLRLLSESLTNKVSEKEIPNKIEDSIFIKDNNTYQKVKFDEIDFIKSDGNYVEIHYSGKKIILKKSLKSIESKFSKRLFVQVHRSYLVNIDKIEAITAAHIVVGTHEIPLAKGKKMILLESLNMIG